MTRGRARWLSLRPFLLGALLPFAAQAADKSPRDKQTREEQTEEEQPKEEQQIVVTATRQEQALVDYAGNFSRIDLATLQRVGAVHHSELLNRVAGVDIQRGSGQESLTALRSPVLTGAGSCGAFLFLENGISIRPVGACNVNDLFELNLEQAGGIEILRGPGSALYGSSAVHGLIDVLLQRPRDMPAFSAALETGADDYLRGRFAAASRGEHTNAAILAHATRDGGFRADSGYREQKLNALLTHDSPRGALDLWLTATNLSQDTAGFIEGFEAYKDPQLRVSNQNPEAYRDARAARLGMHWRQPAGAAMQLNVRAMARNSRMDFLQHFLLGEPVERNGQDSATVLLSLDRQTSATSLTMGIDGEVARSFLLEVQDGPTLDGTPQANAIRPAGRHYDFDVDSRVAGAYAQATRDLGSAVKVTGGVRAEFVRYAYDNRMIAGNTDGNGVPCPFGGCLYNRPADSVDDFTNVSPKLGISWRYAPAQHLYLDAAAGYRAPETAELYRLQRQQSSTDLDTERSRSIEVGARGQRARFTYSLAAFRMTKSHVIFRDANGFNLSDGRTLHRGVEYELSWKPLPTLTLGAAGTFARHTYEFNRAVEGGETITAGKDMDTAPRNMHTAHALWSPGRALDLELEYVYAGSYFMDAANAHRYHGHQLTNLRLGWRPLEQWRLTARVNNVFDRAYADRADFAFGDYRYFPGRERGAFFEIAYQLAAR